MMSIILRRRAVLAGLLLGAPFGARAQQPARPRTAGACDDAALGCATAVTPTFDAQGRLWIAWVAQGEVSVAHSRDGGKTFTAPVVIGSHGAMLDAGSDARPAVAVDARGRVAIAYAVFTAEAHQNAQIMVSTSGDGGATFSRPRVLSRSAVSQRFPALLADDRGALFATWIDQRSAAAPRQEIASTLGYAWSHDGGTSFDGDRVVRQTSCECCAPAAALDAQRLPVVLFRTVVRGRLRDHAVVTFAAPDAPGAPRRVAADRWSIDGCPHHGPSLAIDAGGSYHAAWFTLGDTRQGLFYARSTDGGRTFSAPRLIGDATHQPGHPFLLTRGSAVWLAWKEFDGSRVLVKLRRSPDGGRRWSSDRVVAHTDDAADHPLLASDGQRVYLSWMTRKEGYLLIPLEDA